MGYSIFFQTYKEIEVKGRVGGQLLTSSTTQFDIGKITTIKFQVHLIELFNSSTGLSRLATTLPVFTAYIIDFMTICHVVISSGLYTQKP